jgi:hypothetical protein
VRLANPWWLALFALSTLSLTAHAQVEVELTISAETIEVGQTTVVKAQAMSSDGDAPQSPRLDVPNSFQVHGPSVGTSHSISFVNGRMERKVGASATWELTARRAGEYQIGPATFVTGSGQVRSRMVTVKVAPPGTLPQRPSRRRGLLFDDDDLFPPRRGGSLLDDLFGGAGRDAPQAPQEYRLASAPDGTAFLRAVVVPTKAVLGQQVMLDIYAYGSQGRFREDAPREPRRADFFSYPLVENSGRQRVYSVDIGGRPYSAVLIRRIALFPLKTGNLEIGPMEMNFYGSGYLSRSSPNGLLRQSPALTVQVSEPPLDGRPEGYRLGDVGNFRITAEVAPRSANQGESISVQAMLQGTGRLPADLVTPEQNGVEWLTPTVQEKVDEDRNGRVRGRATFTYVVRVDRSGEIDLGEFQLPFYDPDAGRYDVARAKLGKITVAPRAPAADAADGNSSGNEDTDRSLVESLEVRRQLDAAPDPARFWASEDWFWWTVLGGPLALMLGQGASGGLARWFARRKKQRSSAGQRVGHAFADARASQKRGDFKDASSAIERALFIGIESKTGLKGRAMLRAELTNALVAGGTAEQAAQEIEQLFVELDELRFGQEGSRTGQLIARAEKALKSIAPARARRSDES